MNVSYYRYLVGTKERPTVFMTNSGELSEHAEDASLFETIEDANAEIKNCDEPESFKIYSTVVSICGI